ncbi:kinase-like domain-containing protein [Mycena olivaceomarginata]|nr:kinase-like domain-containing protein [Mycena olivaceomarginata]
MVGHNMWVRWEWTRRSLVVEEEDEEGIREFAISNEPLSISVMSEEGWNNAFHALEARFSRTTVAANLAAHLPSQARLRFMAWLLVVALRDYGVFEWPISRQDTTMILIRDWAEATGLPLTGGTCNMCGVSGVLPVWIETMLEIYPRDDLRSLPWHYKCNCLHSQLMATADTYLGRGVPETPPGRNSPVFHVLYELVVPAWPLFLWVVYRTGANDRAEYLTTFMDILHGPDQDLFTWDEVDDSNFLEFLGALANKHQLTLYPQDWIKFMVEIPLKTWLQINNMTRINSRAFGWNIDTPCRVTAVLLKYLPMPMTREKVLTTLGIELEDYGIPFDTMARAVYRDHENWSALANFNLEQFWTSASLKDWLSACDEALCHGVWHTPIPLLERVQLMSQANNILPCQLERLGPSFAGCLGALQNYRDDVQILVREVKKSIEENSSAKHTISKNVHEHMGCDLSVIVARLVLFLRNQESYKEVLSSRGTPAQRLLDLLQDLLDLDFFAVVRPLIFQALLQLSRASGLHPRCLVLSELQKVGPQVTGGGFGDIWKGLIRGQSVCVKIMRIFEDSNVQALLKEFGREAVIWRQLCHPNVLPFFGIYYLEQRLCLIAPWMDNGHIMKFLAAKNPTNPKRLSLVTFGLHYLHENKIVHGDLKGLNILVTPSHRACIADFGLSAIAEAMTVRFTHTTVTARGGTARYQAPELFEVGNPAPIHYGSDVYAFSCVTYEILTGKVPFYELRNDMAVMTRVAQGYRPPRPDSCSSPDLDGVWELMQKCWEEDVQTRPTASQIVEWLGGPLIGAQKASSTSDWSHEFTSKFRRSQQAEPLLPSVSQIEHMLFDDGKFMLQVY